MYTAKRVSTVNSAFCPAASRRSAQWAYASNSSRIARRSPAALMFGASASQVSLLGDPFTDVPRAIDQLDAFACARRQELHHRPVHERRLGQVEHESRSIAPQLRLDCMQVILVDLPTESERGRLSVRRDLDLERHARDKGKRRATTARARNRELRLGSVPAGRHLPTGEDDYCLRKASLSICRARIFDSSVWRGMPSCTAAPRGPATLPRVSLSAASMSAFSPSASVVTAVPFDLRCLRASQDASITSVSLSLNTTARSITFCSSRTLPGQS